MEMRRGEEKSRSLSDRDSQDEGKKKKKNIKSGRSEADFWRAVSRQCGDVSNRDADYGKFTLYNYYKTIIY